MQTPLPPSPFIQDPGFVLDVDAFMAAVEPKPLPLNLSSPALTADELMPLIEVLTAYR